MEGLKNDNCSFSLCEKYCPVPDKLLEPKTEKVKAIMKDIDLNEYTYDLPPERIAQYPVDERDMSQILVYKKDRISKDTFRNIDDYLTSDSLLVFNNTRVIRARILFQKETGASIEVLCLEPLHPSNYEQAFLSRKTVEWKCIIGNLKKWKKGEIKTGFIYNGNHYYLTATRIEPEGEAWRVRFNWDSPLISFSEVIESVGHIPLPPYIKREDESVDNIRYQTIFSQIKGSVAAPTAGLHFTDTVLDKLRSKGIKTVEITLHVGAGTFQPVKSNNIASHKMHCEHFFVTPATIELLIQNAGKIIPVGTTSVRTLESLYWLGVKILTDPSFKLTDLYLGQWEAYEMKTNIPVRQSLEAILNLLNDLKLPFVHASTNMIIIPGYDFKMINGMITNFHQPGSTLLLLVSAWVGQQWKVIYKFALENNIRFLSYGDCSLLLR